MNQVSKIEQALAWAKARLGQYVQPCRTIGCKYSYTQPGNVACSTPGPAPDADDKEKGNVEDGHAVWNFYCMRFVRSAFGASADYPKAEDMYQALLKQGAMNESAEAPKGALVFWHWSTFGHIGISSGGGKVIHTGVNPKTKSRGIRESDLQEITEVLDGYNRFQKPQTSYLGWAHAPAKWLISDPARLANQVAALLLLVYVVHGQVIDLNQSHTEGLEHPSGFAGSYAIGGADSSGSATVVWVPILPDVS